MNTIEDVISVTLSENQQVTAQDLAVLRNDLVAREQAMAEALQEVAMRFNLMPAVVSKVITHLGLGEPVSEEMRAYIDAQYADLLVQIEAQRQQAIAKYREMGVEMEIPPLIDPLGEGAPESLVIPDSPEA